MVDPCYDGHKYRAIVKLKKVCLLLSSENTRRSRKHGFAEFVHCAVVATVRLFCNLCATAIDALTSVDSTVGLWSDVTNSM